MSADRREKEIRIPVTVGNITFKNPFYVASGPTTKSVRQLMRIEETGWAAASIKLSIDPAPYINRKPRYSLFPDRNALAFTAEKRLTFAEGLRLIEEAKPKLKELILMANITYAGDEGTDGWVNMARCFQEAGADIIELNMCCPNMSYNLELTGGGKDTGTKKTGASMGQHAEIAAEIVSAIKGKISIPLFVKLTPEGGQIASVAKALFEAGADAVGGTGNRLGMPPINLDEPGKAYWHLQEEISMGCHCGPWLKPLAQRDTYEIRKVCGPEVPITATGGIANWKDAAEMVLCGGTLLGVCAETLISGYDIVRPMIRGLKDYMTGHGYADLNEMRSIVVPEVRTANDLTIYGGYAQIKEPNLYAPCKSACPMHLPVQACVQKIAKRDYHAAFDLLMSRGALHRLCAAVCTQPCGEACVRGRLDAPLKIRDLMRFVTEFGRMHGWKKASDTTKNGLRVAVAGAGPAGLACASELSRAGYSVTVFEKEAKAGGRLRCGAPDYTFDMQILDETVADLEADGVRFAFGRAFGKDFSESSLREEGYSALSIATGACAPRDSGIPGAELAEDALAFLENGFAGVETAKTRVAVIGSGFAAVEAARTAVRLGAEKTVLLWTDRFDGGGRYREALTLAREEGVSVLPDAKILRIEKNGVLFTKEGSELSTACDRVFLEHPLCASQGGGELRGFSIRCRVTESGIADAVAAGMETAAEIDLLLRGDGAVLQRNEKGKTVNAERVRERAGYLKRNPNPIQLNVPGGERKRSFMPFRRLMTEEEAVNEAARCLNCGCGEGCQLCREICCEFAPEIASPDKLTIKKEACVACGMCFNRCPNGNIEMVNLGVKV